MLWKDRGCVYTLRWSLRPHHPASDRLASNPLSTTCAGTVWLLKKMLNFSENHLLHLRPRERIIFPSWGYDQEEKVLKRPMNVAMHTVSLFTALEPARFGKAGPG